MRKVIFTLLIAVLLTIAVDGKVNASHWLSAMFSDNVVLSELYEDGSGFAIDNEGNKITFCIVGAPCDESSNLYIANIMKGN